MTAPHPIERAKALPAGAVFYRCALQVNPESYGSTFRGRPEVRGAEERARAIIERAIALNISALAITDHNSVAGVETFRRAAEGRVGIFPGFELASSEGIHVLCIYSPSIDARQLERFLGEFGITNVEPSGGLAKHSFVEVLRKVREQGGLPIAAHVTNDNGLFRVLQGQARIQAWRSEDLLAIQIPGAIEDLPQDVREIVQNKNPDYRRAQAPEKDLALAVINASDVLTAEDLVKPSATCWIKMSELGIEGLRQAFLDPGSRIRLGGPGSPAQGRAELVAAAWEGGFLDGNAIRFNPNLNVLIGGRGAGKSTVIESIRAVLAMEPLGDDARRTHEGIVRHVLRSGTRVSLLVRILRPASREYQIERTLPNPPLVRDAQGNVLNLAPRDVLPDVEIYGQHELSELTGRPDKLTRLLDRFVERDESWNRRKAELQRELEQNRQELLQARAQSRTARERLAALPGLEETLQRFREAGLEERLQERSLLVREEQLLDSIPERIAAFQQCLETLKRELPLDRTFVSARALEDLPGRDILSRLDKVFQQLDQDLQRVRDDLERALIRVERDVAEVRGEWNRHKQQVQAAYEKILRDLQRSRVDGEEFIRLRRQIEGLRPLRERLRLLERREKELVDRRRALLAEWEDLKAEEFRRLDRAADRVSRKLQDRLEVQVTPAGNREPLFKVLREQVGGRLAEAIESLQKASPFSVPQFVAACRGGADNLSMTYNIPPAQAERLAKADEEVLMCIEELDLPPTTSIRLNTAPAGAPPLWQTLEELSTGQKATAILLLLLLESDAPLIIDQPEDDLDNRFITEGIVPRMRQEKQRRQFIFSTHNANIPVLGDAELIVGLTASGEAERGRARVDPGHVGSIDSQGVRELVEEILEGGKEAFERRRRKYGF